MSNVLPTWRPPKPTITRPSAERVNELQPQKQTITVAGYGEVVPLVYGRAEVAGPVIAGPIDKVNGTIVYYAIALSHGTINKIISAKVGSDEHTVNVTPTAAGATHTITGDGYTYECRFYDGNQTTHDTMLVGQLTNYKDVFSGVSYVRIKMSGVNASWGGIDFEIEGKKVLDPRSNTIVYSENPALHLNDFVSNPVWGLGRQVIGVEAAANECDRILAYGPKSRTGHTINTSASESGNLELLAMYAEVLFGFIGDAVVIVPDAAVDEEDIIDIPPQQIWSGSVRPSSKSAENIPSSITITFNTKDTDGLAGSPAYVSIEQTSASDPVVNSALTLIGVYRREEAQRRANQRLAQLRTPGRVSFQMFDSGIYFKAGDVVRMPDTMGLGGSEFRLVADPLMVRVGVYQMEGEVYNPSVYAGDVVGTLSVPMNAIIARLDDKVPDGTSTVNDLGFIFGDNAFSQTSGSDDVAVPSNFSLASAGGHTATKGDKLSPDSRAGGRGSRVAQPIPSTHTHAPQVAGTIGLGSYNRTVLKPVKVDRPSGLDIPIGSIYFTRDSFWSPGSERVVASGMLELANSKGAGQLEKWAITLSQAGDHTHTRIMARGIPNQGVGEGYNITPIGSSSGGHTHNVIISGNIPELQQNKVIAHITKTTQSFVPIGGILPFLGDDPIPQSWALCDGSNGTHDLTGGFIGFDDDVAGSTNLSVSVDGLEIAPGGAHDHSSNGIGLKLDGWQGELPDHDPEDGLHTHEIEWQGGNPFPITVTPRYTKIRFIQYIGE